MRKRQEDSLAGILRQAIVASGQSMTDIAASAEIHPVQLSYFLHKHRDLNLANADKLMKALGLRLTYDTPMSSR